MDRSNTNYRLGDLLVMRGIITKEQLQAALAMQQKAHRQLGECLVSLGAVTEDDIVNVLEVQLGISRIDLRGIRIDPNVIGLVSGSVLRRHTVLPITFAEGHSNVLILAMANPMDMVAQDDISIITNCSIEPRIATVGEINTVLDRYFGTDEAMSAAEQYSKERESQLQQLAAATASEESELDNAPIVQLVRSIIEQAVRQRASDIHFDALEKQLRVRYRVDGVLSEKMMYDISLLPAIVTRVKILGGMDISEKRKPQDGRITTTVDRNEYDIRVSVLPTSYGEKIVMRLASTVALTRTKAELGMQDWELERFDHILSNPNGIILVTGPTGSGKSTTLYTALSEFNRESVNIITVEDPVEANIPGINQVQVNPKADLSFAAALRAILRQDPDIIMIGEIRDYETASIAVQASITGHLVVSTLHTNSSASTITRLLDMGVESYLLADSVVGVIAQRLVRKLCKSCRKPRKASAAEKQLLGVSEAEDITVYTPCGCPLCGETGFYGRIGVYEIMEMTPELKKIITARGSAEQIKEKALKQGMRTLRMSAAKYVLDGVTTIDEMLKVSFEG
ncbi:ATPase, T2SS/T4P/T4SS family [Oscillibacter sp.]|uniref:GspE/PulE family protein n=1 Tax=Oscillibacter sp. TaxID=1945593 RepID=UPI0026370DBB|nr:ATPase, T2SS/T4P/T4SS family [Oscillibacter sp.]MDD3347412.1 ATPase, T2SS/T4P/T4SS family [Oscillibacter sp.]